MPRRCPKCKAMLQDGVEECPYCGTLWMESELGEDERIKHRTVFWYSLYITGIVLISFLVTVGIGLLCIFIFLARTK